ncbi:MAG: MgtC/SapB family protein [Lachnospiraceae bacterium]|nr:MgtC/SapB family protein [Lachnospiraceae bacterium]
MVVELINYWEGFSEGAIAIRLVIAALFGSLIGWERVTKNHYHYVGIRTFALVSLGSAVAIVLNMELALRGDMQTDVGRIPAGVVSGIGFLGAGMILVTGRNRIKGLTTAASIWVTANMGMAVGAGYLKIGTICFALILISNRVLQYFSQRVERRSHFMSIYLEVEREKGVMKLRKYISDCGYELLSMSKVKEKTLQSSDVAISVELDLKEPAEHSKILEKIGSLDYVNYLEEG